MAAGRGRSQRGLAIAQERIAPILAALADGEQQLNQARADGDARLAAQPKPPEGQREVLSFVELLETRLGRGKPHKSLSGAWADLGVDLSAEDIDQARREP